MTNPKSKVQNPTSRVRSLAGNAVVAEAAVDAGCRFYAGYPITPSSEVAAEMSHLMPRVGGVFIQMEDEIASMGAVIGASLAGLKAMTATSGPGFSLKQENIGFACMAEVPCVIVNVMRGGPSTGLPTLPSQGDVMQARWGTHGDHPIIVLTPSTLPEIYEETIRAFNLAERYRAPVVLLLDEIMGHMSERVELPDPAELEIVDRARPDASPQEYVPYAVENGHVPPMADFFSGHRYHVTGLTHDPTGFPTEDPEVSQALIQRLGAKITDNLDDILKHREHDLEDAEVAVLAYGSIARSARVAIANARQAGIKAGLFQPLTLWPFPEEDVAALAGRVKGILVPEMNMGQVVREVERVAGSTPVAGLNKANGQPISPVEIETALGRLMEE
ncbi:MAG: 2-oxoacid:acceptor oxidoreductase subunit alpha [Anaerolineae bacterium]